jgi:hypothetical protein
LDGLEPEKVKGVVSGGLGNPTPARNIQTWEERKR